MAVGLLDYIRDMEIAAIAAWRAQDPQFGYNVAGGGQTSPMHNPIVARKQGNKMRVISLGNTSKLGKKATEATRELLRLSHLGKTATLETRLKMSVARMGRKRSPELCEKMRARRGEKRSPEAIANIRAVTLRQQRRWSTNGTENKLLCYGALPADGWWLGRTVPRDANNLWIGAKVDASP